MQSGLKCAQCHVNPTGGGLRTTFGNLWAQSQLAATRLGSGTEVPGPGSSADARHRRQSCGRTTPTIKVPNQESSNGFDLQEARLYLDLALIPNRLSVYLDERMGPGNAEELEANVRLWLKPGSIYIKAGQFYLPFGWRLEDDNAYVRQLSGISMQTPDRGVEIGMDRGRWSMQLAVSNGAAGGPEVDDGKQVTARLEYVPGAWRVGVSAMHNNVPETVGDRTGVGAFGGFHWRQLSLLGEIDLIKDKGLGASGRDLMAHIRRSQLAGSPGSQPEAFLRVARARSGRE